MQLVVDVRIPELFGGLEGEAIFIGKVYCLLVCAELSTALANQNGGAGKIKVKLRHHQGFWKRACTARTW